MNKQYLNKTPILALEDTLGLIDIQGRWEAAFWYNGKPVSLMWPDCGGSIAEFFKVGYSDMEDREKKLTSIRNLVEDTLPDDINLVEAFGSILQLLSPGNYQLFYYDVSYTWFLEWDNTEHKIYCAPHLDNCAMQAVLKEQANQVLNSKEAITFHCSRPDCDNIWRIDFSYLLTNPYPMDEQVFLATRHYKSLDEDRVEFFVKQIESGKRPVPILLSHQFSSTQPLEKSGPLDFENYRSFVLDGHHKLTAYNRAGVPPRILWIVKYGDWEGEYERDLSGYDEFLPKGPLNHFLENRAVN